jgi:glucokinase
LNVIGVDIGGTNVRAGPVAGGHLGDVVRRFHDGTGSDKVPYQTLLDGVLSLIGELRGRVVCEAIGISVSGILSLDRSTIISNSQTDWVGRALAQDVAAITGLPAAMENDGNCATWAEYVSGVGRGVDPFALMTLGTGVGGGVVVGGRLALGSDGFAGEFGHICVETRAGLECPCGASGCLEQYASGRAIVGRYSSGPNGRFRETPGSRPPALSPGEGRTVEVRLARGLESGEPWAARVIEDAAAKIAIGVSAIVRVLDPPIIGIGGGAADLGAPLLTAIRQAVENYAGIDARRLRVQLRLARHREYAGIVGSALLAAERLLDHCPSEDRSP